jgi:hypothetical protein
MRNGAEPLTQGCFGLMVCLVAEAIRWNSPLQVDPEPSERIQFEVLRSPAVSSAAPNSLGPGIQSPLLRAPRTNGTRNGIRALAVGCGVRYPVSWNQVNPIRSARFNAATGGAAAGVMLRRRVFGPFSRLARFSRVKVRRVNSFRRPRWGGRMRLGAI